MITHSTLMHFQNVYTTTNKYYSKSVTFECAKIDIN